MRRMWLGLEIDVVGLPPLGQPKLYTKSPEYFIQKMLKRIDAFTKQLYSDPNVGKNF